MALSTPTVALGLVGALLAPLTLSPTQFVSLLVVGAFLGSFVALLARSVAESRALDTREALAHAGRHGLVGALWAVAAGALVFSFGSYGWGLILAAAVGYLPGRCLLRRLRSSRPAPFEHGATQADHPGQVAAPLEDCTTSELAAAWAASYDLLQVASSPQTKARIVALRGAYLDELERRDRGGVMHWLSTGVDPARDAGSFFRNSDDEGGDEPRPGVTRE